MIIPLAFFPDWLADNRDGDAVRRRSSSCRSTSASASGRWELVAGLALQAGWAVVLLGRAATLLAAGTRKLVVQGG